MSTASTWTPTRAAMGSSGTSSGLLSGAGGTYTLTLKATNTAGLGTGTLTLSVAAN